MKNEIDYTHNYDLRTIAYVFSAGMVIGFALFGIIALVIA